MAEVLVQFDRPLVGDDGRSYVARVCGRVAEDGLWEGWIEFTPDDGSTPLRTPRETDQPNRTDLEYWATGLTEIYLEGALRRAMHPHTPRPPVREVAAQPAFDAPAPSGPTPASAPRPLRPHGVLDPFEVYLQGEDVLREELGALDEGHLRNIMAEHALGDAGDPGLRALRRPALVDLIVAGVKRRAG